MSATPPEDYYALLGVEPGADPAELRRAWQRVVLRWHPDRAGDGATETFRRIASAYEVLSNPLARAAYDRRRRSTSPQPVATVATTAAPRRAPAVVLSRLTGPLSTLIACGAARRAEDDVIELLLGPTEAEQGGMATVSMPVALRCSECADDPSPAACKRCGGARAVDEFFSAWLAVPPGVADGAMLAPSVPLRGMIRPVRFRVRVHGAV